MVDTAIRFEFSYLFVSDMNSSSMTDVSLTTGHGGNCLSFNKLIHSTILYPFKMSVPLCDEKIGRLVHSLFPN